MKKVLLLMALLSSWLFSDSVLLLKKGWQLIGLSSPIVTMSDFNTTNVEEIWHFDASTQQWFGYSPDANIQLKMDKANVPQLHSLKSWHGFWIKSKEAWALTLEDETRSTVPVDENSSNDIIELKTGWNLISLPVDSVLSADIFKGMTVWKYNSNEKWELFDEKQDEESFPPLGHIKNSDGLWVKAPNDINLSVMDEALKLHNFSTTEEMEAYIREMATIYNRPYCGIEPFLITRDDILFSEVTDDVMASDAITSTGGEVTNATETNLQESEVDESDIVKHDGVHIFYGSKDSKSQNHINVTTFGRLASGNSVALKQITFDDKRVIDSFYLVKSRLIVLSTLYLDSTSTQVDIFDVSDIENIKNISATKVDGDLVTSRVVGENLYLVTSFTPQYTVTYPKIYQELSEECRAYVEGLPLATDEAYRQYAGCYYFEKESNGSFYYYDYDHPTVTITDLMPEIESDKMEKQSLITPSRLYASAKHQQLATMTTVSHIDVDDGTYTQSNSFIGYSSVQYASSNAFYLVSNQYPLYYDFNNYKKRSVIYKFDFDTALNYKGVGSVYGDPLNQFALSEYNDVLRMATTEGFSWGSSGTNNSIYTLKEQNNLLEIEGVLSGLGKEGETIRSVRFIGDRGYVVTFRQTDPLYTIDLSNPSTPLKVGELEVNGYSAYLHPIGEDKLLGIGRDADANGILEGVKLELFDVSDFAHPTSLDSITLANNTYSELESNHKALAYRSSDNLFAFPYRSYANYQTSNALGIYQVKERGLVAYDAISSAQSSGWGEHRGLIFDMNDTTYVSFFAGDSVVTKALTINN